jgi:CxxC motif-containing protein
MSKVNLICIECPMGCALTVAVENNKVTSVEGSTCARGRLYAENEVICPMRVVTSTVQTNKGIPVSVKTDKPVKKAEIFNVMSKINKVVAVAPIKIGDVLVENIEGDANLVATMNFEG